MDSFSIVELGKLVDPGGARAQTLRLPQLSHSEARDLEAAAIILERSAEPVRAVREALETDLQLCGPPRIGRGDRECVAVRAAHGEREATVFVDCALSLECVNRLLRRQELVAPRALIAAERGVLAYLALCALRSVASEWRLVDVENATSGSGLAEIDVRAFGTTFSLRVQMPVAPADSAAGRALLGDLPQTVRVSIGATRLSARDLGALELGDAIIFDQLEDPRGEPAVTLLCGRLRAAAKLRAGRIEVLEGWRPYGGITMNEGPVVDPARLDSELVAEVGRIVLSGKEVMGLRPGVVLSLGRKVGEPIDLTSGGRIVARAELVDLEGDFGLRVTEILVSG